VAAVLVLVFLVLVFGLRAVLLVRRTGDPGFAGWLRRRLPHELTADVLFVVAWALVLAGTLAGPQDGATVWAGAALLAASAAAAVWAQEAMGGAWRTGVEPERDDPLVTAGPFQRVRHPVYTSMLAAAAGAVLMAPHALTIAGALTLLAGLELQVRTVEEPVLRARHGRAYADYARRAGRFLPWVGRG